jgi:hypothetical protein
MYVFTLFAVMYYFGKNKYKRELALLLIFTIYSSSAVGFTCALLNGEFLLSPVWQYLVYRSKLTVEIY